MVISEHLKIISEKIGSLSCHPHQTTLIAVIKSQPFEKIKGAIVCGQRNFGENYAQEFLSHQENFKNIKDIRWHFIGHLQKNKVRLIIDKVDLIHSLDSDALALEINKRAKAISKIQPVLIEVNLGGEETKSGIAVKEVSPLIEKMNSLTHIDLQGFMTVPPYKTDPQRVRPFFQELRKIRDEINKKTLYKHPLSELSMGMSHDFEVAIEEGATMVRIGTGIFGAREKSL